MKIKKISHGMACRIGDVIYINRKINPKSKLYKALIQHEMAHSSKYTLTDIYNDFKGKHLEDVKVDYYEFLFRNPSAWTLFLPITKYEKHLVFDPIMLMAWAFAFVLTLII